MKEKSFKRKNELLEAALEEFTTKSYENASLNTILKNTGISKGTFYYHFQNKKALYIFLLESAYKTEWEFINKRMEERTTDFEGKDIFERLKLQSQIGIEFAITFPQYLKLAMMFQKEENEKILECVSSVRKNITEIWLEKMITNAMKDGDFNNRFSKDFITKIMNYLFIHKNELFDVKEDYEKGKLFEDVNNLIDFLKCGFGK